MKQLSWIVIGLVLGLILAPIAVYTQGGINNIANLPGVAPSRGGVPGLFVQIMDSNGNQITTFGGGTQYTEGDVDAAITGTALMFEGAANTLVAAPGTAALGLLVNVSNTSLTTTADTELPAAAALSDSLANPTTPMIGAAMLYYNSGSGQWARFEPTADPAEDASETNAQKGPAILSVRRDTAATSSGSTAEYATFNTSAEGGLWAVLTPTTTSGLSTKNMSSSDGSTALTNSAQEIKDTAGLFYGYYCYNPNATAQFVQIYGTADGSVTVGTTNPLFMLTIPATGGANLTYPYGVTASALSASATSTAGGNGAPGTALDCVFWYK